MRRGAQVALLCAAGLAGASPAYTPDVEYTLHCEGCHLSDGSATPGKVPALAGSLARFLRVPGGRAYLARVPGVANAPLSDAELAALLDWTLRRFDGAALPPDYVPYTAEEIHALRERPLVDVGAARDALLEQAAPQSGSGR